MSCLCNRDDIFVISWWFLLFCGICLVFVPLSSGYYNVNNTNSIIIGTVGGILILSTIVSCIFNPIKRIFTVRDIDEESFNIRNIPILRTGDMEEIIQRQSDIIESQMEIIDYQKEPIVVIAYLPQTSSQIENIERIPNSQLSKALPI